MREAFPHLEELERKGSVILEVFLPKSDSFEIDFLIYRIQRETSNITLASLSVWNCSSSPTDFIYLLKK